MESGKRLERCRFFSEGYATFSACFFYGSLLLTGVHGPLHYCRSWSWGYLLGLYGLTDFSIEG